MIPKLRSLYDWILVAIANLVFLFVIYHWLQPGKSFPDLSNWSYIAQIITAIGVVGILYTAAAYKYQIKRDNDTSAIAQIEFFREKIIPKTNDLIDIIQKINPLYSFPRPNCSLKEFTITFWWKNFPDISKIQADISKNNKVYEVQIDLLNILEDFSLKVLYIGTVKHEALKSIQGLFIKNVEQNLSSIFAMELSTGAIYPGTRKLYEYWKNLVDRRSRSERAHDLGMTLPSV